MSEPAGLPLGPVLLDVEGLALTDADRRRLLHPLVGGVILFKRNYESPEQLLALTHAVRALREPRLIVCVDQEGGRVQRFRSGFTAIPPMRALGRLWDAEPEHARAAARSVGRLIGAELSASGLDFSFAPVLDLDYGTCAAIGDRAFHRRPDAVAELAGAVMAGLQEQGCPAVGKHFPGHGFVSEDSHVAVPVDRRSLAEIEAEDLRPYVALIPQGLAGVMPSHVIYPAVDGVPAGFSTKWIGLLRQRLGFRGVVFSDDLSMEGASVAGGVLGRARAALGAGCDMVLVCNRPDAADELLAGLEWRAPGGWAMRIRALHGGARAEGLSAIQSVPAWRTAALEVASIPIA